MTYKSEQLKAAGKAIAESLGVADFSTLPPTKATWRAGVLIGAHALMTHSQEEYIEAAKVALEAYNLKEPL